MGRDKRQVLQDGCGGRVGALGGWRWGIVLGSALAALTPRVAFAQDDGAPPVTPAAGAEVAPPETAPPPTPAPAPNATAPVQTQPAPPAQQGYPAQPGPPIQQGYPPGQGPQQGYPPPAYAEPPEPPADEAPEEERGFSKFYLKLALTLAAHAHVARYRLDDGRQAEQTTTGTGYGVQFLLGAAKKTLALGLAGTGVIASKATLQSDDIQNPMNSGVQEKERSVWAFTLGPGVAYHVGQVFRIGGQLGYAQERVPSFDWPSNSYKRLSGFGAGFWLGGEWAIGGPAQLGIMGYAETRTFPTRDVATSPSNDDTEGSVTLGLGLSFTVF